jgi:hypothetical protein
MSVCCGNRRMQPTAAGLLGRSLGKPARGG